MTKEEYKGYSIQSDGTFGMKTIKSVGKGALPKSLKGSFTNATTAKRSIDIYITQKGSSNAKENAAG